jgi:DNA-binding CsgD family transcriptional regulator
MTKIQKIENIPEMILNTELFALSDGQIMAMCRGQLQKYEQLPKDIKDVFYSTFLSDYKSQVLLEKMGFKTKESSFQKWLFCKFGSFDPVADLKDGQIQTNEYNNVCTDYKCKMRGRLCNALNSREEETLILISKGYSVQEIADTVCLSFHGIKNRISHLKEKLNAKNSAELGAIAIKLNLKWRF